MRIRQIAALLGCAVVLANAPVQAKKMPPRKNFTLIEAYKTTTKPATPKGPKPTGEHFIIKWTADTYPATFYWRGQSGFMMCNISKAHKKGKKYVTETVPFDAIHKGDTLEILPIVGGKVQIPEEIPQDATNTLFYRTNGNSIWMQFAVQKISRK